MREKLKMLTLLMSNSGRVLQRLADSAPVLAAKWKVICQ